MTRRPIAITAGDPAGIGPDLLAALPAALPDLPLVLLADREVLTSRAAAESSAAVSPSRHRTPLLAFAHFASVSNML